MQRFGPLQPGTVTDAMGFATRERAQRPGAHVEICMITTTDGVTAVGNQSAPLGGPEDQAILRAWRQNCDIVLVGAGTVRKEGYGLPGRPDLQIAVVTESCSLDWTVPLFASGRGIIATSHGAPQVPVRSLRAGDGAVDLSGIIRLIHDDLGASVVHVEGGPTLNAALLGADLVDAINLTFSPRLAGPHGGDPIVTAFAGPRGFALVDAARDGDFVFTRYERAR
ncbi:MAG: dihydrofolate reductase family protein [Ilumatobacteraceae bacterium]